MGGAGSSTIMAMAQCRFRVCHATARGAALDPHCATGNGLGGESVYGGKFDDESFRFLHSTEVSCTELHGVARS